MSLLVQVRNLIDQRPREWFSGPVVLEPSAIGVTRMDQAFLTKGSYRQVVGLSRSPLHHLDDSTADADDL